MNTSPYYNGRSPQAEHLANMAKLREQIKDAQKCVKARELEALGKGRIRGYYATTCFPNLGTWAEARAYLLELIFQYEIIGRDPIATFDNTIMPYVQYEDPDIWIDYCKDKGANYERDLKLAIEEEKKHCAH